MTHSDSEPPSPPDYSTETVVHYSHRKSWNTTTTSSNHEDEEEDDPVDLKKKQQQPLSSHNKEEESMWQQQKHKQQQKKRVQLVSHNDHHEHLRQRPRADTMPTSITGFNHNVDHDDDIPTTLTMPEASEHKMTSVIPTTSSSPSVFRHRSGSITLPPSNPFGDGIFNNNHHHHHHRHSGITSTSATNDPKSPTTPTTDQLLKEDDGNTIASTLASLGLDDIDKDHRRHTIHASHSYSSLRSWYNPTSSTGGDPTTSNWPSTSSTNTSSKGGSIGSHSGITGEQQQDHSNNNTMTTPSVHQHHPPHHHPRPTSQGLMMAVANKFQAQRPRAISMSVADNRPPFENMNHYLSPHHRSIWQQPHQQQQPLMRRQPAQEQTATTATTTRLRSSNSSADLLEMMARQQHRTSRGSLGTPTSGDMLMDDWDITGSNTMGIEECSSTSSPASSSTTTTTQQQQQPTRSLWLGNMDPTLTMTDLQCIFSQFGVIETIRILPDRECAFINFFTLEDALRAKEGLMHTLNGRLGNSAVKVGFGKADAVPQQQVPPQQAPPPPPQQQQQQQQPTCGGVVSGELGANAQGPTRALWIGNIPSSTTYAMLFSLFSPFGIIESVRVLTHKNCGFVNFELQEDAMRAKKALQGKEIMGPATGPIRIGFAKVPALPTTPTSGTMMPTPPITNTMMPPHPGMIAPIPNTNTMIPTMTPPSAAIATSMSRPDYHNFDPMTMAATAVDSTENLKSASTFGGWSTTSSSPTTPFNHTTTTTSHPNGGGCTNGGEGYQQQQMMMYMMAEMMGNGSTNIYAAIASERQLLMSELGGTEDENDGPLFDEMHMPLSYFANIPAAPELGQSRRIDIGRLRDIRKRLDTGYVPTKELEVIALECLDEIIELCSDHIGNTVIQRLFERCSEVTKSRMLDVVAPYLASIGIHKNGTWAAQKIIDTGRLPAQINRICASIKPYVPALLLDQFGNYVVQCCLGLGPERNQFIFDAIVDNCWEIAQGRFGARAVRATLESPHVTKRQQKYVAATIIQHALVLATNANGALLLIWLLDTSGIPGRYRVLAPRLTPHLTRLCTHKLASLTVLKIINQRHEPDARALILDALIFNYNNNNHDQQQHPVVIDEVLKDQVHGVNLIQKILSSSYVELRERQRIAERMKQVLNKLKLQHVQGYKRLMEEINMVMGDSNPGASLGALPGLVPPSFAMNPEVAAAFHAKYLAAAAAAVQAATSTTTTATATAGIVEGNANTGNAGTTLSSSSTLITTSSPVPEPRTSMDQPQQVVVVGDNNELVASPTVTTTETTTTATTTAM